MAAGAGFYFIAIFTTIMTTVLLVVLRPVSASLERRARRQWTQAEGGSEQAKKEESDFLD